MNSPIAVRARINGAHVEFVCGAGESLLESLRETLGLRGPKVGCTDGNCGACAVILNGRLVNSCLVLAAEIDGQEVTTIEGLSSWPGLHPIQQAFIDEDALQCGYCTPGMILAVKTLLDSTPDPTDRQIRAWIAGNLCRCTGYETIIRAVRSASRRMAEQRRGGRT
jgi:carbon-monoxide dehydrogenase small subunit